MENNNATEKEGISNYILHRANTRGYANHGWLESYHSFSFAGYQNLDRMNFGVLRVLNDDTVSQGMGFGKHPHDNMEIISIPLEGDLEHQDSMGNATVIKQGDIQVMSAGTGIFHSEYNKNKDQQVKFLQIWIYPNQKNVTPRYDQISLSVKDRHNKLQQILSPNQEDQGVWIYQDAWFYMGKFDLGFEANYSIKKSGNGVYAFVLKGSFIVGGIVLDERDGLGISTVDSFDITANAVDSEILLMEVPMRL
jgi:redox-sensitive bicupin YhaK (pirin superfamily)